MKKITFLIILFLFFYSCEDEGLSPNYGCTDASACNYNSDDNANINDGSCTYPADDCIDCDGIDLGGQDCEGVCGGSVEYDCTYDENNESTWEAACGGVEVNDCLDVCGGNAVVDACNICDGDGTGCDGCDGVPNSGLVFDECGVCDGDGIAGGACNCDGNVLDDCGVCGGENASMDDCGVCDGDGSSCSSPVDYESEIQPIFSNNCDNCHNGSHASGLDLRSNFSYASLFANSVIDVVTPESSILYDRIIRPNSASGNMPPGNSELEQSEKDLILNWINEGANQ